MSNETVIAVENLGKRYRIRHQQVRQSHVTLRDVLADKTKSVAHRLWSMVSWSRGPVVRGPSSEDFWALKDVSFEVRQGETLGIIGRNGAGKSTLLKILSRITEPTEGRVRIRGRVASLLEVGTGFHPELTGRENIYLNGAILGMGRAEIQRKFDEIVAFADVEKFLDTPVKRFSSGMYVRLAFAVAAHLEPEILIVDEVLAVGDAQFQKKCLGKMGDVAKKEGRTVLFVSHNMAAVQNLCKRGLLLHRGQIAADDLVEQAVTQYVTLQQASSATLLGERTDRQGSGIMRFQRLWASCAARGITDTLCTGEAVTLVADYWVCDGAPKNNVSVSFACYDQFGRHVFMCWTRMTGQDFGTISQAGQFRANISRLPLMPGRYTLNVWCEVNGVLADWVQEAAVLNVIEGDYFGTGRLAPSTQGGVLVDHRWDYMPAETSVSEVAERLSTETC